MEKNTTGDSGNKTKAMVGKNVNLTMSTLVPSRSINRLDLDRPNQLIDI
jgi:hypothetical protein